MMFLFSVGVLIAVSSNLVNARECGETGVFCHGLLKGCVDTDFHKCEVLAKVAPENADAVWIDLSGHAGLEQLKLNLTGRWIGVGFSLSGRMPNTAVVHCFQDLNNTVHAKLTFNIPGNHFNMGWKDIDQTPLHIESARVENGELHCVVHLQKKFKIKDSDFDLSKEHHLLVATGNLRPGADGSVGISKHDKEPAISSKPQAF